MRSPATVSSKRLASGVSGVACQSPPGPKRVTGVQQPRSSTPRQVGVGGVHDQPPVARHAAQQLVELPLDGGQVRVDVRVVEFEVVQDRRARPVVQELGALVEKRRVVLVRLDHERPAAQARRDAEVLRHAADQKARRRGRPGPESTPAGWRWWSCRGCRPPPARAGRPAPARPATAGRRCRAGRCSGCVRPAGCRATGRCRSRTGPAGRRAAPGRNPPARRCRRRPAARASASRRPCRSR